MSGLLKPCTECGELTERPRCTEHQPKRTDDKRPTTERGYDWQWQQLSKRARVLQPFCEVCGTSEDLTTDHSPEAWRRKAAGKSIRIQDVAVLCRSHNSQRGAAR